MESFSMDMPKIVMILKATATTTNEMWKMVVPSLNLPKETK